MKRHFQAKVSVGCRYCTRIQDGEELEQTLHSLTQGFASPANCKWLIIYSYTLHFIAVFYYDRLCRFFFT